MAWSNLIESSDAPAFNPATGMRIVRLINNASVTLVQEPTTTGAANAKQIEFGPAFGTGSDPVQLLADGTLTFNTAGTYRIKLALQFGRSGSSGTSLLLFRVSSSGVQLGRSIAVKLTNANDEQYLENDAWFEVPVVPASLNFEVMRDAAGNDSGGLFGIDPTVEGGAEWNDAPSAAIRVQRWEQT